MRVLAAFPAAFLLFAACQGPEAPEAEQVAGTTAACALAGASEFADVCRVIRTAADGRVLLTLVAQDGGFRRVALDADGTGIAAADGAEPARIGRGPTGEVEVAIAGDRYRLPAAAPAR